MYPVPSILKADANTDLQVELTVVINSYSTATRSTPRQRLTVVSDYVPIPDTGYPS
jgi:hypothetical protein